MPTSVIRKSPSAEAMLRKWGTPAEVRAWEAQKAEQEGHPHPSDVEVLRVNGKTQLRSRSTGKIIAEQG